MIRHRRLSFLLLALLAGPASAEDAWVRVEVDRPYVYVGETVEARLVVALSDELRTERLVPLFRRPLDWSIKVDAPWLDDSSLAELRLEPEPASGITLAVQDDVRRLTPVEAEAGWTAVELRPRFRTRQPGVLRLEPTRLRLAVTSRFDVDVFGERVPVDRTALELSAEPVLVEVRPLPEEGRPATFSGAVGSFDVDVDWASGTSAPTAVVTLSGAGRLADAEPPGWPVDAPAPVGVLDDRGEAVRVLRYELSPHAHEFPSLTWTVFDTGDTPGYRTLTTDALAVPGVEPPGPSPSPEPDGPPWGVIVVGLGVAGVAIGVWARSRRDGRSPERRRMDELLRRLDACPDEALGATFVAFVGDVHGWEGAAVVSPDLTRRLTNGGVDAALAREIATAVERITEAGYGGRALGPGECEGFRGLARRLADHAATPSDG